MHQDSDRTRPEMPGDLVPGPMARFYSDCRVTDHAAGIREDTFRTLTQNP